MKTVVSILLTFLLSVSSAYSEELCLSEELSLTELIDIALKNNPETERAWWSIKRSQAAVGMAESDYYPTLWAQGKILHARQIQFPEGASITFDNYGAELGLSFLLLDFGSRAATVQATKHALMATNWYADFAMQRTVIRVAANYYEYLNAIEVLKTWQASLNDAEIIASAAKDLYTCGLRSITDLSTSRAAVAELQMNLAQQKARLAIAYGKLLTSLGLPIDTCLVIATIPEEISSPLFCEGTAALIALAMEQRSDLLARAEVIEEKIQFTKRINAECLPRLRALGSAGWLHYTKQTGSSGNYAIGLALDVPIFKGFENISQNRWALADTEISSLEMRALEEEIALEVLTYSELVKGAQESLKWSNEYLNEATQSYTCSLESYKAGLRSIFDLLQAQNDLANARIKKTQAETQYLVSLAQLGFATGSLMK